MSKTDHVTPCYLIEMKEGGFPVAMINGMNGAETDLHFHMANSVSGMVSKPIRYVTNYYRRTHLQDLLRSNDVLVVSQRFREAVEPWLKDYEFLPVELELSSHPAMDRVGGGEIVQDYWWLNSWRRLDLIDQARSEVYERPMWKPESKYFHSPIRHKGWRKLIFAKPLPPDEHFFGLAEFPGEARYVSPELHKHLIDQKLRVNFYAQPTDTGYQVPFEERQRIDPFYAPRFPQVER